MATPQMLPTSLLYVFIALLCVFSTVVSGQFNTFSKYDLPTGVSGPESAAFGALSAGPFTTVNDGRIMKWRDSRIGFVDFAYTTSTRSRKLCDGTTDPDLGPVCGRPLALSYQRSTNLLYIVDAYFGLLVVGRTGGLATQLVGGFKFLTGVDVNLENGDVYFIDASLTYELRNTTQPGFTADATGRLLRYNPDNKQVSVLLSGLNGGGGPAVSSDGRYVMVPELTGMRISKYWLAGPKANTAELLLNPSGNPNKIKRARRGGEFWVAVSVGFYPRGSLIVPQGVRINSDGVVLQTVSFATQFFNRSISLVQEQGGKLYVGSRSTTYIGVCWVKKTSWVGGYCTPCSYN